MIADCGVTIYAWVCVALGLAWFLLALLPLVTGRGKSSIPHQLAVGVAWLAAGVPWFVNANRLSHGLPVLKPQNLATALSEQNAWQRERIVLWLVCVGVILLAFIAYVALAVSGH